MTGSGRAVDARTLEAAAHRVAAMTQAELVGIFRRSSAHRPLRLCAGIGWRAGAIGNATVSGSRTAPVGRALTAGEPVIVEDLARLRGSPADSGLLRDHGVVSGAQVAIGDWGVLGAYARARRRFGAAELGFLRGVADMLAMAAERARVEQDLRDEIARLEADRQAIAQRTRAEIAQLLHDDALQSMLTARQYLASALAGSRNGEHLVHAHASTQRAIAELRAAVRDLHPAAAPPGGLRETVEAVAARTAELGPREVAVEIAVEPSGEQAPLLLSMIRELVANVASHAGAARAGIQLVRRDGQLILDVWDDGRGMEAARPQRALAEGRIGLASVTRRARALGGDCEVESRPGRGTRVRVRIPSAG